MKEYSFTDDVLPLKDRLYRLALRITLQQAEAEDVVQETLIRVWEHRSEWPELQSIEAYSLTICRRLALDAASRAGRGNLQLMEHDAQPLIHTAETNDARERLALVRKSMDSLPEVQRSIMHLRDMEGLSYQEIGKLLQLSESQVKVYLHRARAMVRSLVEKTEKYGL